MKDQPTCQTCGGRGLIEQYPGQAVPIDCPDCTGKQPEAEVIVGNATAMKILEMDVPAHPTSDRERIGEILGTHFLTWRR